jgi:DNA-binding IclR family transcriptional regulator
VSSLPIRPSWLVVGPSARGYDLAISAADVHTAKGPEATANPRYRIAAVDRAVAILESFAADQALTQAEVARAAGLSETTTLRYLATLQRNGLVERDPRSGRYSLGLRMFQLGRLALGPDVRRAALPFLRGLAETSGETVNLAVRNADNLVVIEAVEGSRSIRRGASIGDVDVWHASALGKAILSALPETEAAEIVERCGWRRCTARSHTNWKQLSADLATIAERGYSIDDEEGEEGLRCLGAAILDGQGRPQYAVSVSGPANRITDTVAAALGAEIRNVASQISARIGFASPVGPFAADGRVV